MNQWAISTKQFGTMFAAKVRRIDRAEPYFLSARGKPELYHSAELAELAGHRHVLELLNSEPRFEWLGGPVSAAVALEESVFGEVTSRKGKKTTVTRRRQRQAAKQRAVAIKAAEALEA